jgi:homopolymeric O-antigen transport system ATP-binding protein
MSNLAIRVDGLSKKYKIGVARQRHDTLRDAITDALTSMFRFNGRGSASGAQCSAPSDTIWALKDVSFEINHGEVVGFIGKNGAGKSTLFKILSRITEPTIGKVEIFGRVGSLLEVGTGFHGELTGRENLYLNGAILGMKKAEIDRKFDEIVAFAEIEKFIDTPVKRYSSGMYIRLAFAVAAHLEPEILIVDEVLAVGDMAFQTKCLGKMNEVAKQGRTVLFVSHNIGAVQRLCDRVIWLQAGQVRQEGDSSEVLNSYLSDLKGNNVFEPVAGRDRKFVITKVTTKGQDGREKRNFMTGENLIIELEYQCSNDFRGALLWIAIGNRSGLLFAANMCLDGCRLVAHGESGRLSATFKELPLAPQQQYLIKVGGRAWDSRVPLFSHPDIELGMIQVVGSSADISLKGDDSDALIGTSTPVLVPYEWDFGNGNVYKIDSFKNANLFSLKPVELND